MHTFGQARLEESFDVKMILAANTFFSSQIQIMPFDEAISQDYMYVRISTSVFGILEYLADLTIPIILLQ